jgi:hypothetical protein
VASAWGSSWGRAWGNSWGSIGEVVETSSRGGVDYGRPVWEYVEKVERARERAWEAARETQAELRRSLEELIEGRPKEARAVVAEVQDKVQQAVIAMPALPGLDDLRFAFNELQELLGRLIRQRTIRQGEMRKTIEQAVRLFEAQMDDEDAMVAILMAGA